MTARVAMAAGWLQGFARLPRKAQRKAEEFIRKFTADPKQPSIHYEPIRSAVDKQLRSVRIGDDYRAVIRAPEQGDIFVLLWVDHHDEAYRWAETKQLEVHPVTGTMQIFDIEAASRAVTSEEGDGPALESEYPEVEYEERRLFSDFGDDQLFVGGLPRPLIPAVRALYTDTDLDRLLPHLPKEAAELLTGLAAGYDYDTVLEQILDRPAPSPVHIPAETASETPPKTKRAPSERPPIDTSDLDAALARESTQREFRLLDETFDLDKALTYPLDVWRVYLHPSQRKIVRAQTKGPMRVTGGAGTGKTVVAMHRIAYLARDVFKGPDDRLFLTTFTTNLAHDIRQQLEKLLEPEELARIDVQNLDAWASQYLRSIGRPLRLATNAARDAAWKSALDLYGVDGFDRAFCEAEWTHVVQEQNIRGEETYLRAVRRFRGKPLLRPDRRRLWGVFEEYRSSLEADGVAEAVDILRTARVHLETATNAPRYRAIVVDETQDLGTEALRLLRASAGPERPNDLFLVGDSHQRIYGRPTSLSQCGINVRGRRSHELRLNYRSTAAICRWSTKTLGGAEFDDLDQGTVRGTGYVSLRPGAAPTVKHFDDVAGERRFLVEQIQTLLAAGTRPDEICVVARLSNLLSGGVQPALEKAGIDAEVLEQNLPRSSTVRLATMHRVKGLEFPIVFATSVNDGIVPLSRAVDSEDPVVAKLAETQERCLLYVAATRARDRLFVTSAGVQSPFVSSIDVDTGTEKREALRPASAQIEEARAAKVRSVVVGPPAPDHAAAATPGVPNERTTEQDRDAILSRTLAQLRLPARIQNYADREHLSTLRDLVLQGPLQLLEARALGRKTVAQCRSVIETELGARWEEVRREILGDDGSQQSTRTKDGWSSLLETIPPDIQGEPVGVVGLPTRLRTYCESKGVGTLGELLRVPRQDLVATKNLGRRSVENAERAILTFAETAGARRAAWSEGLLASWKASVQDLDTIPRMVLTRRAGFAGQPETLESIAQTLGVTRERIRQIESKQTKALCQQERWLHYIEGRIVEKLGEDAAVALDALEADAWWTGFSRYPHALDYFCRTLLGERYHVVSFDEADYLARLDQHRLEECWKAVCTAAEATPLPTALTQFASICQKEREALGATLAMATWNRLQERLQLDDASGPAPMVVAVGTTKRAQIIAALAAKSAPVHVSEIIAEVGRFPQYDEVLYFDRGMIGLKKHFPDFDAWQAKIIPVVGSIMNSDGPERQWSCSELIDNIREELGLPPWLGHWHLASLLRSTPAVEYLGRLRVALPGVAEDGSRVYVRDHFAKIMAEAGRPMNKAEILTAARKTLDFNDMQASLMLLRPPFLKCDVDIWGLLQRDLPGGTDAAETAAEHLQDILNRRGRGLTAHQLQQELGQLSPEHAQWTPSMGLSVVRSNPLFRLTRSGNVGLDEWDSVQVPTRKELLEKSLVGGNGRVSLEAFQSRVAALYGSEQGRADVASIAATVGAKLVGEWIVALADRESEPNERT